MGDMAEYFQDMEMFHQFENEDGGDEEDFCEAHRRIFIREYGCYDCNEGNPPLPAEEKMPWEE